MTADDSLLAVGAHRDDVTAAIRPLPPRMLALDDAGGTVLAEDVTACWPLPLFRNSAMDGYAVAIGDVTGATHHTPVTLAIEGEIAAGDTRRLRLPPGTCMRILTGALVPEGAEAVVRCELVTEHDGKATFTSPARPGESVRPAGGEARPGDLLLAAGTLLGPAQLGLLAAAGQHAVLARTAPRVTILSGGNELIGPGARPLAGQAWESNSFMLAAAARRMGCRVRRSPVTGDFPQQVLTALEDAIPGADLLITSGGISMGGEHDAFKAALGACGTVSFRRVAMRPGMPQGIGTVGNPPVPILLLPGNPVSAFISFTLFAAPAIRALQGSLAQPATTLAVLTAPVTPAAGKTCYIAAVRDPAAGTVTPAGTSPHQLTALSRADALIIVPAGNATLHAGERVDILELDR